MFPATHPESRLKTVLLSFTPNRGRRLKVNQPLGRLAALALFQQLHLQMWPKMWLFGRIIGPGRGGGGLPFGAPFLEKMKIGRAGGGVLWSFFCIFFFGGVSSLPFWWSFLAKNWGGGLPFGGTQVRIERKEVGSFFSPPEFMDFEDFLGRSCSSICLSCFSPCWLYT